MTPFAKALIAANPERIVWVLHGRIQARGLCPAVNRPTSRCIGLSMMGG